MSIFFSSDHHFSHANIIKYCDRPFTSIWEMNNKLIALWNETVGTEDFVWYLGDFSMGYEPMLDIIGSLNGTKVLVHGNHDACSPHYKFKKRRASIEQYKEAGWQDVQPIIKTRLTPRKNEGNKNAADEDKAEDEDNILTLSHYPLTGQPGIVLCGHVHTAFKISGNNINVGVDQWDFRPISLEKIREIVKNGMRDLKEI